MGQIRKRYSAAFKAKVVLKVLKETRSVSELSAEHSVHTSQLHRWRREATANPAQVFTQEANWQVEKARYDAKVNELYTEIGRLGAQLSWPRKEDFDADAP